MSLRVPPRSSCLRALVVSWSVGVALALAARTASAAGGCSELAYSFQPDCYHPNGGAACGQTLEHLDFGPQSGSRRPITRSSIRSW
jgi:hypothetical protein